MVIEVTKIFPNLPILNLKPTQLCSVKTYLQFPLSSGACAVFLDLFTPFYALIYMPKVEEF